MDALQQSNRRILFNLLPSHVATHFLDGNSRTNLELYHQVRLSLWRRFHRLSGVFLAFPGIFSVIFTEFLGFLEIYQGSFRILSKFWDFSGFFKDFSGLLMVFWDFRDFRDFRCWSRIPRIFGILWDFSWVWVTIHWFFGICFRIFWNFYGYFLRIRRVFRDFWCLLGFLRDYWCVLLKDFRDFSGFLVKIQEFSKHFGTFGEFSLFFWDVTKDVRDFSGLLVGFGRQFQGFSGFFMDFGNISKDFSIFFGFLEDFFVIIDGFLWIESFFRDFSWFFVIIDGFW